MVRKTQVVSSILKHDSKKEKVGNNYFAYFPRIFTTVSNGGVFTGDCRQGGGPKNQVLLRKLQ